MVLPSHQTPEEGSRNNFQNTGVLIKKEKHIDDGQVIKNIFSHCVTPPSETFKFNTYYISWLLLSNLSYPS
jgi:hypothetical protein